MARREHRSYGQRVAASDRDAILARRALLLGAALAGISSAGRAAPERPPCAPATDPDPQALQEAQSLFESALGASDAGDFQSAKSQFARAFTLSGKLGALYKLALAHRALDEFSEAAAQLERVIQCGDPGLVSLAEADLAELRREAGQLVLEDVPEGAVIELDGRVQEVFGAPILIAPGQHSVVMTRPAKRPATVAFVVAKGEMFSLSLANMAGPDCDNDPGLCMPCLSPPPPPPAVRTTHLGIEAGYSTWISLARDQSTARIGHGLRVEPFVVLPMSEDKKLPLSLRFAGLAAPTWTPSGDFLPLGADVALRFHAGNLRTGGGVAAGYRLTNAEPRERNVLSPAAGLFLEPHIDFLAVRLFEPVNLGLRIGHHFANYRSTQQETFGLGHVNVGLWLSLNLTADCDQDDYGDACPGRGVLSEDEENVARRFRR